jgi:Flp pilus assembly protein TadD
VTVAAAGQACPSTRNRPMAISRCRSPTEIEGARVWREHGRFETEERSLRSQRLRRRVRCRRLASLVRLQALAAKVSPVFEDLDLGSVLTGGATSFAGIAPSQPAATAANDRDASHALTSQEAFRRAAALHENHKFAEAEAILREAIACDPNNSDLRNTRGAIFAPMGRDLDVVWCGPMRETRANNAQVCVRQ